LSGGADVEVVGVDRDPAVVGRDTFLRPAHFGKERAALHGDAVGVAQHLEIARLGTIERGGLFEEFDGFLVFVLAEGRPAEIEQGFGVFWFSGDDGGECGFCLGKFVGLKQTDRGGGWRCGGGGWRSACFSGVSERNERFGHQAEG